MCSTSRSVFFKICLALIIPYNLWAYEHPYQFNASENFCDMPKAAKEKAGKATTPKKDPLTAMNEMIQEKLEKTRACLSCLQNQLKQKEMIEKMGTAIITRVMNPEEPEMVSFSYPNQIIIEELMATAKSLATPGKGVFAIDEFVEKKLEVLNCLELNYVDLEEDDKLRTTRMSSDLILKGCVDPWAKRPTLQDTNNNNNANDDQINNNNNDEEDVLLEKKRRYVELLLNTENLCSVISGLLLVDPQILQMKTDEGKSLADIIQFKDLIVGTTLELDTQMSSLGECTLLGLDNLGTRIIEKRGEGYQFLEVLCQIRISQSSPTPQTINENCRVLGRFSNICQANRVVPIINLDIFARKNESPQLVQKKTESILVSVCKNLLDNNVILEGMLLKMHTINPGPDYTEPTTPRETAMSTITTLSRSIPPAVPGIIFGPDKYEEEDFLVVFNETNRRKGMVPWGLNFMYGTFADDAVLKVWKGDENNVDDAQKLFSSKIDVYQRAALGTFQLEGGIPADYIFELNYLNESVDPCENFYEFTCGNFQNYHPLPAGESVWDNFYILQDQIHQIVKEILQEPIKKTDSRSLEKAKSAYLACTDLDYIDNSSPRDLEIINDLDGWPIIQDIEFETVNFTFEDIAKVTSKYGVEFLFNFEVVPNLFNASENVLYITADNLNNAGAHETRITETDGKLKYLLIPPFEKFLKKVIERAQQATSTPQSYTPNDLYQQIQLITNFTNILGEGGYANKSFGSTVVIETIDSLQNWTDTHFSQKINLNWLNFINIIIKRTGTSVNNNTKIMLSSRSTLYGILKLFEETPPHVLKNFVIARLLLIMAPDLDKEMRTYHTEFYDDHNLTLYERPEYCMRKILDYPDYIGLSYALANEYFHNYFNKDKIIMIAEMADEIFESFIQMLKETEWMDEPTKEIAIDKIEEIYLLLALPNSIINQTDVDNYYKNLRICDQDHFGNSRRLRLFRMATKLSQITKLRDRQIWSMSPLEINAYYSSQNNRIQLPIAMLNPIFYTDLIESFDYGRLGMVIGHEITHALDSQGRYYDKFGTYSGSWWSSNVSQAFDERQECFIEQYSKYYIPEISSNVNSIKTIRENIADNGGLRTAYNAFIKSETTTTRSQRVISEYTPEQLFFIGFGTLWCSKETEGYLSSRQNSTYPPNRFRVIGPVSNMDEFARAFNCTSNSSMNPETKCILW